MNDEMNTDRPVPGRTGPSFLSGLLAGGGGVLLLYALFHGVFFPGGGSSPEFLFPSLPELRADLGDGDYLFFPNRRNMWVVNPRVGRVIHYKFLDTPKRAVEKSYVGEIDQKTFPLEDTVYILSERNIMDLLWVCNRRTGDFQLWRRNVRDGRLVTDPLPVSASRDLLSASGVRSSLPGDMTEGEGRP